MTDIKVLVVADGIFSFGPQIVAAPPMGSPDERDVHFTISQFISILRNSQSPTISITTAHRRGDPNATITTAFNFHTTVPDLSIYDVIWLFGDEGTNNNIEMPGPPPGNLVFIGTHEVAAIAEFMNGGGNVEGGHRIHHRCDQEAYREREWPGRK